MNEIIEILKETNPIKNGYRIKTDKYQKSHFVSGKANKKAVIWSIHLIKKN